MWIRPMGSDWWMYINNFVRSLAWKGVALSILSLPLHSTGAGWHKYATWKRKGGKPIGVGWQSYEASCAGWNLVVNWFIWFIIKQCIELLKQCRPVQGLDYDRVGVLRILPPRFRTFCASRFSHSYFILVYDQEQCSLSRRAWMPRGCRNHQELCLLVGNEYSWGRVEMFQVTNLK